LPLVLRLGVFVLGFTLDNELDFADKNVFCVEVHSVAGGRDEFVSRRDVGVIIAAEVFQDSAPSSEGVVSLGWNGIDQLGVECC
jgi:hypothetical protein